MISLPIARVVAHILLTKDGLTSKAGLFFSQYYMPGSLGEGSETKKDEFLC